MESLCNGFRSIQINSKNIKIIGSPDYPLFNYKDLCNAFNLKGLENYTYEDYEMYVSYDFLELIFKKYNIPFSKMIDLYNFIEQM